MCSLHSNMGVLMTAVDMFLAFAHKTHCVCGAVAPMFLRFSLLLFSRSRTSRRSSRRFGDVLPAGVSFEREGFSSTGKHKKTVTPNVVRVVVRLRGSHREQLRAKRSLQPGTYLFILPDYRQTRVYRERPENEPRAGAGERSVRARVRGQSNANEQVRAGLQHRSTGSSSLLLVALVSRALLDDTPLLLEMRRGRVTSTESRVSL